MIPYCVIFVVNIVLSFLANWLYPVERKKYIQKKHENRIKQKNISLLLRDRIVPKRLKIRLTTKRGPLWKVILYNLLMIVLLMVNVVFVGSRDFGVGFDTNLYISDYYTDALNLDSIYDIFMSDKDIGYLILAWMTTFFTENPQGLLYSTEFLIMFFFLLAIHKLKEMKPNLNYAVFMLLFFFMFYLHTLNLMRQFCALAILFYSFVYILKHDYIRYILLQILAVLFHPTAFIFILLPVIANICGLKDTKLRAYMIGFAVFLMLIITLFFFNILAFLGSTSSIAELYADRYAIDGEFATEGVKIGLGYVVIRFLIPFVFIFTVYKSHTLRSFDFRLMLLCYIICIIFNEGLRSVTFVSRIAYYIQPIYMFYFIFAFRTRRVPLLAKLVMLFSIVYMWYDIYVVNDGGRVSHYTSEILGIE